MYGETSLAEVSLAETPAGAPIIPEVVLDTKTLVFVVEIDLIKPGES